MSTGWELTLMMLQGKKEKQKIKGWGGAQERHKTKGKTKEKQKKTATLLSTPPGASCSPANPAAALIFLVICLHSALAVNICALQHLPSPTNEDEKSEISDSEDKQDKKIFSLHPKFEKPEPLKADSTLEAPKPDAPALNTAWVSHFDFPPLSLGPTKAQVDAIIAESVEVTAQQFLGKFYKVYAENCTRSSPTSPLRASTSSLTSSSFASFASFNGHSRAHRRTHRLGHRGPRCRCRLPIGTASRTSSLSPG